MKKFVTAALLLFVEGSYAQIPALQVSAQEAKAHRLGSQHVLRTQRELFFALDDYLELNLTVSPEGSVVRASAVGGNKAFFAEASERALTWKYVPFEKDKQPVFAQVQDYVRIVAPEKRPPTPVPFPDIADWNSLRISLSRSGCFGFCPTYKIEVRGDGSVYYYGYGFVKYCGEYRYAVTDSPTSIAFDGRRMSVVDYVGYKAGMPISVVDVEDAIDRLAGPETWSSRRLMRAASAKGCTPPPN